MRVFYFLALLALSQLGLYAQAPKEVSYPSDYFDAPLHIERILSGTFGELRSNHFHAGLDIKTQGREGLQVFAAAEGHVSRIKVSPWGYGKALYIEHPNGYTTVYAHLQKFSPKIEAYVKKRQYAKEAFAQDIYLSKEAFPIKRQEMVALSGNTGGSGGPHLHFEVRDTRTQHTLNPMLFGIGVGDDKAPKIQGVYIIPTTSHSYVQGHPELRPVPSAAGSVISVKGEVGIGVQAYDQLNGAYNKNGVYGIDVFINGEKAYSHRVNALVFSQQRFINSHILYEQKVCCNKSIQRCWVQEANPLGIYDKKHRNAKIELKEGEKAEVRVEVLDFKGNVSTRQFTLMGSDTQHDEMKAPESQNQLHFAWRMVNRIETPELVARFDARTFYEDMKFDFMKLDSLTYKLHGPQVAAHKYFTFSIDLSDYPDSLRQQMYLVYRKSDAQAWSPAGGKIEGQWITGRTRSLGDYFVKVDTTAPSIKAINIAEGKWVTKQRDIRFKISDRETGIESYRAQIDGKWILMEYDPKKSLIFFDLNDLKPAEGNKHLLELEVMDGRNNVSNYSCYFFSN